MPPLPRTSPEGADPDRAFTATATGAHAADCVHDVQRTASRGG